MKWLQSALENEQEAGVSAEAVSPRSPALVLGESPTTLGVRVVVVALKTVLCQAQLYPES